MASPRRCLTPWPRSLWRCAWPSSLAEAFTGRAAAGKIRSPWFWNCRRRQRDPETFFSSEAASATDINLEARSAPRSRMDLTNTISSLQQAQTAQAIQIKVASKVLDAQRQQGAA